VNHKYIGEYLLYNVLQVSAYMQYIVRHRLNECSYPYVKHNY